MIRDYWGIVKPRLIDEIRELNGKIDPLVWDAIDAVREVGHIGAHMEKDVNLIIDVDDPGGGQATNLADRVLGSRVVHPQARATEAASGSR